MNIYEQFLADYGPLLRLRRETGARLRECQAALVESDGDYVQAKRLILHAKRRQP
jgi:translation elongation factor EF-Ts